MVVIIVVDVGNYVGVLGNVSRRVNYPVVRRVCSRGRAGRCSLSGVVFIIN
jgi:hypothetical protein